MLTSLPINVKGMNGQIFYITGVLKTKLFYTNQHMHSVFLVMPAGELSENILLGRPWMKETNCQLDWVNHKVTVVVPEHHCTHYPMPSPVHTFMKDCPFHGINSKAKLINPHPPKCYENGSILPLSITYLDKCPLHGANQSTKVLFSRRSTTQYTHSLKPRKASTNKHKPYNNSSLLNNTYSKRWIRKDLLVSQNYYAGNHLLWIPITSNVKKSNALSYVPHAKPHTPRNTHQIKPQSSRWVPKSPKLAPTQPMPNIQSRDNPTSGPQTMEITYERGECSNQPTASSTKSLTSLSVNLPSLGSTVVSEIQWPTPNKGSERISKWEEPTKATYIHILVADAEPNDEFLRDFQNWEPDEGESSTNRTSFFNEFYSQLPREIKSKIMELTRDSHYADRYERARPYPLALNEQVQDFDQDMGVLQDSTQEEDLLYSFRLWQTSKEERRDYEQQFLANQWPNLPPEIRRKIQVLVFRAHYYQRHPFGLINAPFTFVRRMQ